ncbi:MAG: hypothetical protein O6826_08005 [Acidobacteria bacterium]|nr:hypothetical protein [Acidobacteriota bacterium]
MVLSRFGAFASLFNLEKLGEGGRVLFGKRQMGLKGLDHLISAGRSKGRVKDIEN